MPSDPHQTPPNAPAQALPEGAEALIERGEYAEALLRLESARSAGPASAEILYRIGYCKLHLGRYGEAQEELLQARKYDSSGAFRFRISVALANLMLRTGRYADAAHVLQDLIGQGGHTPEEETLLHYSLGQARYYLGQFKDAIGSFKKALVHYRRTKSARGIVSTLQSLAAAYQLSHESDAAIEAYLEAYRIAKEQGESQSVGLIYLNLGALYQDRGHYANAYQYFTDALATMRELGRVPYEVSLLCNLGNLCVRMGLFEEAQSHFAQAEEITGQKRELRSYRGYLLAYRAELHRERGDFQAASLDLDRAQEIFSELKNPKDLEITADGRVELACLMRDRDAARGALRVLQGLGGGEEGYGPSKAALLEAKIALLDPEELSARRAGNLLERAAQFFRHSGYLPLLWEAQTLLGRVHLASGETGRAREALLRAMDAHQEIRRTLPATAQAAYEKKQAVREFEEACRQAALDKGSFLLLKIVEFNKKLNEGFGERGARDFLADVLDEAIALVSADQGYLFLGEEPQCARDAGGKDVDLGSFAAHGPLARVIFQEVRRTGKPALVFASTAAPDLAALLQELELVSLLAVPIRARGEVLGTIYLHNRFNRGAFTQENLYLVEAFCDVAGLALVNSRRLEQALDQEAKLSEEVDYLKRELSGAKHLVVGGSRAFQRALRTARQAARSDAGVLLHGETGTGKELLAQEVHALSTRKNRAFVRVNVPAIPQDLLESELFGHEPGAFTGAKARKRGLFEIADGGTILLDEIGDLPGASQVKLLRVLQERRLTRLGATRELPVDVRVIAATNRDLKALVASGQFREDLFYRLNVVTIEVPPLRERPEDILPLAEHFLSSYARRSGKSVTGFSAKAKEALLGYAWPGNVRELENLVQRAVLLEDGPVLELSDSPSIRAAPGAETDSPHNFRGRLKDTRAAALRDALAATGGNKRQAAKILGLSRSRFYQLLDQLGVTQPP